MRGFFNGLVLGIILGAFGFWFVQKKAAEHPEAQQRYKEAAATAFTNASEAASNVSDALRAKLDTLDLHPDKIKDELAPHRQSRPQQNAGHRRESGRRRFGRARGDGNQSQICCGPDAFGLEYFGRLLARSRHAFRHGLIARRHRQGRRACA